MIRLVSLSNALIHNPWLNLEKPAASTPIQSIPFF